MGMPLRSVLLTFLILLLQSAIAMPHLTYLDNQTVELIQALPLSHTLHCHQHDAFTPKFNTQFTDSAHSAGADNGGVDCSWCLAYPLPVASLRLAPPPGSCLNTAYAVFRSLFIPNQPQPPPR